MEEINYTKSAPRIGDYIALYESTGWEYRTPVTKKDLETALENTWYWVCAYHQDKLVGIGRLISDGAIYAFVCDMIVLPEYQNKGVGSLILKKLKNKCRKHIIKRVWLLAAPGRAPFYERSGFEVRPQNMPGMQLSDEG